MKIHDVIQGSPEWHALRAQHFCASEAPAMMGASPYLSRSDLLHQKATGIVPEVDEATLRRFADGHAAEAAFRPHAEAIVSDDLFPITASCEVQGLRLLASMDGITLDRTQGFEHKLFNAAAADHIVEVGEPPEHHCWQLEHELLVTGAERILFVTSDGTPDRARHCWYISRGDRRAALIAGWKQFAADLAEYVPPAPTEPKKVGRAPETLPALLIEVTGAVTASNLSEFREFAVAVFRGINRDLQSDQDFADAEKTVKWCDEVEQRLKAAKQHALSQTASIDTLFRAIDEIADEAKRTRLELDRLVKQRKDTIRLEIVNEALGKWQAHVQALNARLGRPYMPQIPTDFHGVIKGKRTVDTLRSAVNDELARAKIAANEVADRIQVNLNWLREHAAEHIALFADTATLVLHQPDALQAIAKQRIADHQAEQAAKLEAERERIRQQEEARARAALAAQQAAQQAAPAPAPQAPVVEPAAGSGGAILGTGAVSASAVLPASQLAPSDLAAAQRQQRPAPANEAPTLTLSQINALLGFTVTAELLAQLGFAHTQVKTSKCYRPSLFPAICRNLAEHVRAAGERGIDQPRAAE